MPDSSRLLTASEVRDVVFRRGYDEDEVDTFLDLATYTIAALEAREP